MKVLFEEDSYPSRLCAIILNSKESSEEISLVVQCATRQTGTKSALLTEWEWSDKYYVVSPEAIDSPCFVISITDDHSKILETAPYSDWPNIFTTG